MEDVHQAVSAIAGALSTPTETGDRVEGECLRISTLLEKRIEAGTAKKLSRGVYTAVWKDRVTASSAP